MNINATKFTHIDKKKEETVVLLPGWGTDWQVFTSLKLENYNWLIPLKIDTGDFCEKLKEELNGRKAVLLGWSFGGILAAHFMAGEPSFVQKAFLIGVKDIYNKNDVKKMKEHIARDSRGYMKLFFRMCLAGHNEDTRKRFQENLFEGYLGSLDPGKLMKELDYLLAKPFPAGALLPHADRITFIHGTKDAIIPMKDTMPLRGKFPGRCFIDVDSTGHMAFLDPAFEEMIKA